MEDNSGGLPPILSPQSEEEPRTVARWRWWFHLILLGAYPLAIGAVALIVGKGGAPALSDTVSGVLKVSASELGFFGFLFALAWFASRASRADLYLSEGFRWRWVPLGLAYSIGLRIGIAIVAGALAMVFVVLRLIPMDELNSFLTANRPEIEALVDVDALTNNPMYLFLNATLVSFVVAGLREELWRAGVLAGLRALWPGRFSSTLGQLMGVSIAAVIFGLGHFSQGILAAFLTAVLGFLLGWIMVFHKSIWPAVLAHGFFNATTFVILPWAMKYLPGMN